MGVRGANLSRIYGKPSLPSLAPQAANFRHQHKAENGGIQNRGCSKRREPLSQSNLPFKKIGSYPTRQYLPLRLKAVDGSLAQALTAAIKVSHQIQTGNFVWANWLEEKQPEVAPDEL